MIDDLISILDVGARMGLITYDEAVVRAPHHDIQAFDIDALTADAARLRLTADRLHPTGTTGVAFGDVWSGRSGDAAGVALASATAGVDAAVAEIHGTATALDTAASTVVDVVGRYRQAMETVCGRTIAGTDVDTLQTAVAAGSVARDDVRAELIARIEYADAVGRTVTQALTAVVTAATGEAATSGGELVLAGGR
ncbi:hypothetical protein [Gordonia sp. (in: high G+C Gram-positive bacteria)]|uniref:hypothetical protein n=1 Tax=Gordonia sp. (in: high G+C Gram-positive bacteria) TaxID=84139 RepID=UPI003F97EFA7